MDDKQIEFVTDNELEYTKLYGVPGGGKTKCIIEKILYEEVKTIAVWT